MVPVSRMYAPTFRSSNAASLAAAIPGLPKVAMEDTAYEIVTLVNKADR